MPAKRPPQPGPTLRRAAPPSVARRCLGAAAFGARLASRPIIAHPVLAGGVTAFAVLFAVVSVNAFHGQPGRHPRPIMATRGDLGEAGDIADGPDGEALMPVPLVLEVQTALASTGHYQAAVDGRPGKATAAAIRAFQSANALPVDGEPSPELLRQIRQLSEGAADAPTAPSDPARLASVEDPNASAETGGRDAGDDPSASHPAPRRAGEDRAGDSGEGEADADLVRRIQSGLASAEIARLKADGILGDQTRSAIRTFEAMQGLDVTGQPNQRVLKRLIKIGAAK